MKKENEKSDLRFHTSATEVGQITQLCEQYKKHINPPNKKTGDLSYLELLKFGITRDLLLSVKNPKKLLTILQDKCDDPYFSSMNNADVLRMNRSSRVGLFFKGLLVLITFPISLPLLMFWSFKTKGTFNFLKADGAIFLENLLPLCTNWVEPPPNLSLGSTLSTSVNPTLRGPNIMLNRKNFSHNRAAVPRVLVPLSSQKPTSEEPIELPLVENSDLKNMRELAARMGGVFGDSRYEIDQTLSRFKGQAMITASSPIRPVANAPNELRLEFTCRLMYTDAPPVQCEITVFKTFSPMVRVPPQLFITAGTNNEQYRTQPDLVQRGKRYCASFFEDNFSSAMEKGHTNIGKEQAANLLSTVEYYERALTLARTNFEKLHAIEAIINAIQASRKLFAGIPFRNFELKLQEKTQAALHQLPADYRLISGEINRIATLYQVIWSYLEDNQPKEAWSLFKSITLSHFLEESCPELVAMHAQLSAVFEINGEDEQLEDGAISAAGWLQFAFSQLSQQNYSLCLMTEYEPLLGAEPGKLYLTETMHGPLSYVIRNDNDTADWDGTITQEEIIENGISMGYCPGSPEDFIGKLEDQLSIIIAVLAEKGHAHQTCTPEAALMRQLAIKPMGQVQQLAAQAWARTPFEEGQARAYALEDDKTNSVWRGCRPSIRPERAPTYLPQEGISQLQSMGVLDPSFRHPDDVSVTDDENSHTSFDPMRR
jgi:hypothetical protein